MTRYVYAGGDFEFPMCVECSTRTTAFRIPADEMDEHDAWHAAHPTRQAVVRNHADKVETIRRYMPANYRAEVDGEDVKITGIDRAGWTLDGYVIPRLASGLYRAEEVTRMIGLSPARIKQVTGLGKIMLREAGEDACQEGYGTTDPFWVGHYALGYGDINDDGTLN